MVLHTTSKPHTAIYKIRILYDVRTDQEKMEQRPEYLECRRFSPT